MSRALLAAILALALAPALAGCLDQFRGEGEESITLRNADSRVVELIVRIEQTGTGLVVFRQNAFIEPTAFREYPLALRSGDHVIAITTDAGVDERIGVNVPTRGDTHWELTVTSTGARLARR